MARKQHQDHETETITRGGTSFCGYQELRSKTTFEVVPADQYRDAYKITFREYVEEYPEDDGTTHKFVFYQLSRRTSSGTEQIGRTTKYTTEDRMRSLLYRYFNPDHARPIAFHGRVRLTRKAEGGPEGLPAKMPYVTVPADDVDRCDLRVDDEVKYTIVNPRGERYEEKYHLSLTANDGRTRSLILPLTRIKRLVVLEDGSGRMKFVKKSVYDMNTAQLKNGEPLTIPIDHYAKGEKVSTEEIPVHRFVDDGDEVSVNLQPEEWTKHDFMDRRGRFDFAINTLMLIAAKRRRAARRKLREAAEADDEGGEE